MNPKRKRKLILVLALLAGVGVAAGLTGYAMRQNINAFYTPSQLLTEKVPDGRRIQVGGMVQKGSLQREGKSLTVHFVISDFKQQLPVTYTGILPDLFKEGQGVIANGTLQNGQLQAEEVLAKHDEKYMPPPLQDALQQQQRAQGNAAPASTTPAKP